MAPGVSALASADHVRKSPQGTLGHAFHGSTTRRRRNQVVNEVKGNFNESTLMIHSGVACWRNCFKDSVICRALPCSVDLLVLLRSDYLGSKQGMDIRNLCSSE